MTKIILSINAGSSSVKVSVYKAEGNNANPQELALIQIEGLSSPPPTLKLRRGSGQVKGQELDGVKSHEDAFNYILNHVIDDKGISEVSHREDIRFVCHRVVHGGDFADAQVITQDTFHHLETLSDLAPLHNSQSLAIVRAAQNVLPKATNIAFFDSAFHSTLPEHIRTYPIDQEVARRNKLRKYGFHGISYAFILDAVAKFIGEDVTNTNLIVLHLGSGASACAIKNGQSLDTSMGLTPVEGLPGATRSGNIDPSLVFHYTHNAGKLSQSSTKNMHITEAEEVLNKKSGWRALTGTANFGTISASTDGTNQLAFDLMVDRILNYIGSYYLKLGGEIDALVFAGGIGEKGDRLRKEVSKASECLGFELDHDLNANLGDGLVVQVSRKNSKHRVLVCRTDEQLQMARACVAETERFT